MLNYGGALIGPHIAKMTVEPTTAFPGNPKHKCSYTPKFYHFLDEHLLQSHPHIGEVFSPIMGPRPSIAGSGTFRTVLLRFDNVSKALVAIQGHQKILASIERQNAG